MDWVDFFDGGLSGEQLKVGLSVAGLAVSAIVVVLVTLVIPHGTPVHWAEAFWGMGSIGLVALYIGFQIVWVARRAKPTLQATTVLLMVLTADVAIAMVNVAADDGRFLYQALFCEVPVFVALIGNPAMRRTTVVATDAMLAAALLLGGPAGAPRPWVGVVMLGTIVALLDSMVSAVMVSVRGRNAARGAVNALMTVAVEAERLDEGLTAALPMVDAIMPAASVAVVVLSPEGGPPSVVAEWQAPAEADAPAHPGWRALLNGDDADPELVDNLVSGATLLSPRWCILSVGYNSAGELLLAIERRPGSLYHTRFGQEMADALAACFLRLTGRLGHMDRLRHESVTDALTGLPNRRQLLVRLPLELARSARSGEALTVAMLDLDHFKEHNDALGHLAGDSLLRAAADAVGARMRAQDLATRYGGDEFCLVLPGTDAEGAHALLEDVRRRVGAIGVAGQSPVPVTVSAGAAVWDGHETPQELLARADAQLLQAKREGRDRTVVAGEPNPVAHR